MSANVSSYYDGIYEEYVENESLDEGDQLIRFISEPIKSERCTIDENIVQIHTLSHSFGYDCSSKFFNICAADDHTVVYAAGSYISVFDTNDGSLRLRKCAGNGGIGHITKNPVSSHLAVGENSDNPLIIVYEWPTFDVVSVLRASTKNRCNWLNFSQNGSVLCSQGGEPDSTLTIWDWRRSRIILRTKSHTQDVYVCRFSDFISNHLVTAGAGHIKFWKMERTFTGLKLLGQLGRFGKTEISDVVGTFSMSDEKIISGCDWGNILVWDEGLIDIELTRKNRAPCHSAPIIMFLYSEQAMELTSVSMDGTIKGWYYHTVVEANPPEGDRVVEMDPSFTISVQDGAGVAKIMGMCKINNDPNTNDYFVQDGNGGIWLVDIKIAADAKRPNRLAKFHGDSITSLQTSSVGYFVATTSLDGWLHVYDVVSKKLIFTHNFGAPVTSSVWLPLRTANSGNIFVIGFRSGILKTVAVPLERITTGDGSPKLFEMQSSKPHTGNISHLAVDRGVKVLVCGSDDCTIFVYSIKTRPVMLKPIGMYPLPGKVNHIHWNPSEKRVALISCFSGHIVEVNVPKNRPLYTKDSFLLRLESRVIQTVSVKSELQRIQYVSEVTRKKQEKLNRKKENLNVLRENNPGVEIDEEFYLQDSDEEETLPEIFVPPTPNPVLFAVYTPSENTVWASIDGYDAGYLYEYRFGTLKPIKATAIPDKNDTPLTAMTTLETADRSKLLMGFADGRIRVTNVNVDDVYDLSDYIEYPTHDNKTGRVKMLCFSRNNHMLYTYGDDGNIFSFTFQCDMGVIEKGSISVSKLPPSPKPIDENIIKTKFLGLSLEEIKMVKEKRKVLDIARKRKEKVRCLLFNEKEKFKQIITNSKLLPGPLLFSQDYFQLIEVFSVSHVKEARSDAKNVRLRQAFNHEKSLLGLQKVNYFLVRCIKPKLRIEGFLNKTCVETLLSHESHQSIFYGLLEELIIEKRPKLPEQNLMSRTESTDAMVQKSSEIEIFLRNVYKMYSSLPLTIRHVVDRFNNRVEFEKNIRKTIENISRQNLSSPVIGEVSNLTAAEALQNSNLIVKKTISMEDQFEAFTHVIYEMEGLISSFNEIVADLEECKKNITLDYKQSMLDVSVINNGLDDPEITTPSDFSDILLDEAINPHLNNHLKSTYLAQSSEKSHSSWGDSILSQVLEKPTYLETTIQELMNKEKIKYRNMCLHVSMLLKINEFDERVSAAKAMRMNQIITVTFIKLFALSLKEELMILKVFDLIEDEYEYSAHQQLLKQKIKLGEIQSLQEDIRRNKKKIDDESSELIEIQQKFDTEVRNNKFAKYLWKIFKKKYKPSKVKVNRSNDGFDSSSLVDESESESDSDSDSDSAELTKSQSLRSQTMENNFFLFDENTKPKDCEDRLYDLTFELRSKRHGIELSIEKIKNKLEKMNKKLSLAISEMDITENKLKQTTEELEAYQKKKKSKLNNVETTVKLNKYQMLTTAPAEDAILLYRNIGSPFQIAKRLDEYMKEISDLEKMSRNKMLQVKKIRMETKKIEQVLTSQKEVLKSVLKNKFKSETEWKFLDDMEMSIIDFMIFQHKSNLDTNQNVIIARKKAIRALEQELLVLLNHHNCRSNVLCMMKEHLQECILSLRNHTNAIKNFKATYQKTNECLSWNNKDNIINPYDDLNASNNAEKNQQTILGEYKMLLKQKQDICNQIFELLQRYEQKQVSNKLLPGSEIIGKMPDNTTIDTIDDKSVQSAEYLYSTENPDNGVFDKIKRHAEHHYDEDLSDEVFNETTPEIDYEDAKYWEKDVFDIQHFVEDMYEDNVIDGMSHTTEYQFAEDLSEDIVDETTPNIERNTAKNLSDDIFDETTPYVEGHTMEDLGEDIFDEMKDETFFETESLSVFKELVSDESDIAES